MKTTGAAPEAKRILIVDDNAQLRRTLRTLLEAQDHWEVADEAADGMEAIAFAAGKPKYFVSAALEFPTFFFTSVGLVMMHCGTEFTYLPDSKA